MFFPPDYQSRFSFYLWGLELELAHLDALKEAKKFIDEYGIFNLKAIEGGGGNYRIEYGSGFVFWSLLLKIKS